MNLSLVDLQILEHGLFRWNESGLGEHVARLDAGFGGRAAGATLSIWFNTRQAQPRAGTPIGPSGPP